MIFKDFLIQMRKVPKYRAKKKSVVAEFSFCSKELDTECRYMGKNIE